MKRKSIGLIIGSMLFALLGVMGMQYYFINQSYNLKEKLFDESVSAALNTVALKAEKKEAVDFIQQQKTKEIRNQQIQQKREAEWKVQMFVEKLRRKQRLQEMEVRELEAKLMREFPSATLINNDFYETYMKDPKLRNFVNVNIESASEGLYNRNQLTISVSRPATKLVKAKDDSLRYMIIDPYMGPGVVALPPKRDSRVDAQLKHYVQQEKVFEAGTILDSFMDNAQQMTSVIENLANDFEMAKKPLKSRIDFEYIREELKEEFGNRHISQPFELRITEGAEDSTVLFSLASFKGKFSEKNTYSTILFPNSVVRSSGKLSVVFPAKHAIILGNMGVMLASSVALLLVLIGCFTYTILIILRQKKISEMKTDFINNMTHEFKTPVATIMIASESLKDPEIVSDPKRIDRLASIIYDENVRLGNHIERVLNIARVEKGDLKLDKEDLDLNDLVVTVVDSMDLQLKKKEAKISLQLDAVNPILSGDELHLSNVIFNLVDNAIKYSKEIPEISIKTKNVGDFIHVIIADKGIGMTKDQLSRIFDQFYRVSTGNLHDVKGFGLGLSYVQDIIKRMKGTIKVRSEKNKGTEFELILPVLHK